MDPDEALKRLRKLSEKVVLDEVGEDDNADVLLEMTELFQGLDGWISRGGFLPKAWERKA